MNIMLSKQQIFSNLHRFSKVIVSDAGTAGTAGFGGQLINATEELERKSPVF